MDAAISRFSPLTRIRSPQSTHDGSRSVGTGDMRFSPLTRIRSPQRSAATRCQSSSSSVSFSPLTRIRSPQRYEYRSSMRDGSDRFQSPDEDSFAPKQRIDCRLASSHGSSFSPLTRIRSPQSEHAASKRPTADIMFQSPDEDSFAPKADAISAEHARGRCRFQSPDEDSFAPKTQSTTSVQPLRSTEFQSPDEDSFAPKQMLSPKRQSAQVVSVP